MKRQYLTETQEVEIIKLYLAGGSICKLAEQYRVGQRRIKEILNTHDITLRTKQEILDLQQVNRTQTFKAKYGVENPFQVEAFKDKIKQTNLERYGCTCSFQNEEVRKKHKQSCLEKYGVAHPMQATEISAKQKQTCLERYGVENVSQVESIRAKVKDTCLERYGVENVNQDPRVKEKIQQTNLEKYGVKSILCLPEIHKLSQQGVLNKYGVTSTFKLPIVKEKVKQTCLKKYGVTNVAKLSTIKEKSYKTKKKNGSFNTSAAEKHFYTELLNYFSSDDIICQYKDIRYPYRCDFYIKSLDLFIELNLTWTHGPHKFNAENKDDQALLQYWRSKANESKYYKEAIKTWTKRDISKFKAAENNNLKYYTFYLEQAAVDFLKSEEFQKVMNQAKNS